MDAETIAEKRVGLLLGNSLQQPPPDNVVFRRGLQSDYEGLKQLVTANNMMHGVDFLPAKYLDYVADPDRFVYVAVLNGKVIASLVHYVVDGGRTVYTGSARRDPAFRKASVYLGLARYSLTKTLTARPSIQKSRACSPAVNFHESRPIEWSGGIIARQHVISVALAVPGQEVLSTIRSPRLGTVLALLTVDTTQVKHASKEDLAKIFSTHSLRERVFPQDAIAASLELFEPRLENLNTMFEKDNRSFTVAKDYLSVGVSQFWQSQRGAFFFCRCFGEVSAAMAMSHLLKLSETFYLRWSLDTRPIASTNTNMSVIFAVPDSIPREEIEALCKVLTCYREDNAFYTSDLLIERPFPQVCKL